LEQHAIAEHLQIGQQQLWRKLKEEGTSYREIRDHIKRDWAIQLLENSDFSVEAIAGELGYADVSAFHKAFKKWTGQQPGKYRAMLLMSD